MLEGGLKVCQKVCGRVCEERGYNRVCGISGCVSEGVYQWLCVTSNTFNDSTSASPVFGSRTFFWSGTAGGAVREGGAKGGVRETSVP